jgi:lipopolysaccharide/colanic/teichoic acid biosynthesis glycosyltransferase
MRTGAETTGLRITTGEDRRITRAGRFLRRHKLDELPQLLNVALGQMSLVGPKPEVPHYVELYPGDVRERVLFVPPGITDYASIEFRNECTLLDSSGNPEPHTLTRSCL